MAHQGRSPPAIRVVYSPEMVAESGGRISPSAAKPRHVAEALSQKGWPIRFVEPTPAPIAAICRVHHPDFVRDVLELRRANGFGSISDAVARSLPYTSGACYDACILALEDGVSASLTSGFHHAGPLRSRGFCTFNGLAIAALRLLDQGLARRVAIVDCDYHYGDGTQAIIDEQRLADRILHVSFGETFRSPAQASGYLLRMRHLESELASFGADVILYQAGVDTHVDDPLGGLLTTDQMRERDHIMFSTARALEIPVAWNLAGGYQVEADGSIPRVVALHLNTFEEALRVWHIA